jgi:hypothetical protein
MVCHRTGSPPHVQLVSNREFITQFHGNEITISLVLFAWLVSTGLGSPGEVFHLFVRDLYGGARFSVALWPLLQLILIRA